MIPTDLLERIVTFVAIFALSILADLLARRLIDRVLNRFAMLSERQWVRTLAERKVFNRLSLFAPALVIWPAAPLLSPENPALVLWIRKAVDIYMIVVGFFAMSVLLDAVSDIYRQYEASHRISIKFPVQVIKIVLFLAGTGLIFFLTMERSPWYFLTGLGALVAALLVVFKDTLLGLLGGIELVANDMCRPGDWIEMPNYGADGKVLEITINTVKVRNWDNTVTTIPTHAMISDSFKNWRGMHDSGGRRIKRSFSVDVNSIQFVTPELAGTYPLSHVAPSTTSRMTNIGAFRQYLLSYLRRHAKIHQSMTILVRQLQPTPKGLPIEVYAFSSDQNWLNYEAIQADIFDHIYAMLPEFGLRAFQDPTGADVTTALVGLTTGSEVSPARHSLRSKGIVNGSSKAALQLVRAHGCHPGMEDD